MSANNLLQNPSVAGVVLNVRDISDRKLVEQELRTAKDQFEAIVQGVSEGITLLDVTGHVVFVNEAALGILGCGSADELLDAPRQYIEQTFQFTDTQGRALTFEDLPGARVSSEGRHCSAEFLW